MQSLERRLLRSHLAVAAIGAVTLLIALIATNWLRSSQVRLATVRGPTARAAANVASGVHQSAEALYGGIVTGDPAFRQARARAWREQIVPATTTLERLSGASDDDAVTPEHLERLAQVLAAVEDWQGWIEVLAGGRGTMPPRRLLARRGAGALDEMTAIARAAAVGSSRQDPEAGRALAAAGTELDAAARRAYAHLEEMIRGADAGAAGAGSPAADSWAADSVAADSAVVRAAAAAEAELARASRALAAFTLAARGGEPTDPVPADPAARLVKAFDDYAAMVRWTLAARVPDGTALAQQLVVQGAVPATHAATQLLASLSVQQEELLLADAARLQWFSHTAVGAGAILFFTLILTAVLSSRRHAARITRPVRELSGATASLAEGRYDTALPTGGADEIGQLARSFDTMREALRERSAALERRTRELERANRELARANDKLGRRNAELDEFTHVASHDLQEPLRKIMSFSKLLRLDMGAVVLPERAARDLEFITRAAARMQGLVQDLLQLSRTGRAVLSPEGVRLDRCVDAALEHLEVQITETGADIRREGLPSAVVDGTLMTQLFQNLIGNAIKFHAEGARPVVRITHEVRDGESIIGVADEGIGLDPEYAEQIFSPFKRLHGRDAYEGTGIGLAICRKAVTRHGGKIWVESTAGHGAHFKFTLGPRTRMEGCREAA